MTVRIHYKAFGRHTVALSFPCFKRLFKERHMFKNTPVPTTTDLREVTCPDCWRGIYDVGPVQTFVVTSDLAGHTEQATGPALVEEVRAARAAASPVPLHLCHCGRECPGAGPASVSGAEVSSISSLDLHPVPTLDAVTPEQWRAWTVPQREAFITYWARHGRISLVCLTCWFPTATGQATCVACRSERGE